jgi:hypothetical protein
VLDGRSCTASFSNVRSSGRVPPNLPPCIIMTLNPRVWLPIAITLLACHRAAPTDTSPGRCGPSVPRSAQHPIASRAAALAGDYDLIQVRTQPVAGETSSGRLHLATLDSAAREAAVGGPVRDLTGWLDPANGDSAWRSNVGSRDPRHPGVLLAGGHLRLGQPGRDGYSEQLTITAVAPDGFWGWWKGEPGLEVTMDAGARRVVPDPAGYFCALRATPDR